MSFPLTTTQRPARLHEGFGLAPSDRISVAILAGMAAIALFGNIGAGIPWQRVWVPFVPIGLLTGALAIGRTGRSRAVAETAFYAGLWMALMVVGIQLTYLGNAMVFPLRDAAFEQADLVLGFHWLAWVRFVDAHHWLSVLQWLVYETNVMQPFVCVGVFVALGRRDRNAELLTAMLIGLAVTILVSSALPALGPAEAHGVETTFVPIIRALRAGTMPPLPYEGIVSFPSFHTVMAILFAYAHRGLRRTFLPFLALNGMMLFTIPYCGQHYLIDVVGGALVAGLAIAATRRLLRPA